MKSGLRDRNNEHMLPLLGGTRAVSMKSGLRDRNNATLAHWGVLSTKVKSQ